MSPWISLERVAQDVRYGVRGFLRTPAFTATVVLTLGLAIGQHGHLRRGRRVRVPASARAQQVERERGSAVNAQPSNMPHGVRGRVALVHGDARRQPHDELQPAGRRIGQKVCGLRYRLRFHRQRHPDIGAHRGRHPGESLGPDSDDHEGGIVPRQRAAQHIWRRRESTPPVAPRLELASLAVRPAPHDRAHCDAARDAGRLCRITAAVLPSPGRDRSAVALGRRFVRPSDSEFRAGSPPSSSMGRARRGAASRTRIPTWTFSFLTTASSNALAKAAWERSTSVSMRR